MSAQQSQLSEEDDNGLRLVRLLNKATEVLRCKFHTYYSTDPKTLYNEISKHKKKLKSLMKQRIISRKQYDILLPATGETDSSKFDLTILTFVLRVFCPIQAPVTGWDSLTFPSDRTDGANLVRIRIERNDLLHSNLKYEDKDYTNVWDRIASSLEGLGCNKQELINLKTSTLDPILQTNYFQKLQDLKLALQHIADLEDSLVGVSYNLHPSTPSFVGREKQLSEIHEELSEKAENQVALVIYGLGG